jgi:hypothetical protein
MARRIALNIDLVPGAWGNDYDTENLFPAERPLLEDMADEASGARDIQPRKTLRNRQYNGPAEPLIVRPEYSGDFLDKLREQYKNKSADSLLDFSSPEDMLKYLPDVVPRDLTDEFYDINKPGPGAGMDTLKDFNDRGWDEEDAPEMSEDKILRMRRFHKPCNCFKPVNPQNAERVINAFIQGQELFHARSVVAKFLGEIIPTTLELNLQQVRVAKLLSDLEENSRIYTQKGGWRKPGSGLVVPVRLVKEEPRLGRWTFSTGSHDYTTIFQFIPDKKNIMDLNRLHVRVTCSCPSWVFWGAQYNALMRDYLYGPIRTNVDGKPAKVSPPVKRDSTGKFLVCKHVLACIRTLNTKSLEPMIEKVRQQLKGPYKVEVEEVGLPEEDLKVNKRLKYVEEDPVMQGYIREWLRMGNAKRRNIIMGLKSPDQVAYLAHRFPKSSTKFVVEKLKKMYTEETSPQVKAHDSELIRDIVQP